MDTIYGNKDLIKKNLHYQLIPVCNLLEYSYLEMKERKENITLKELKL